MQDSSYSVEATIDSSKVVGQWTTFLFDSDKTSPSQALAIVSDDDVANSGAGNAMLFGFLPQTDGFLASPVILNIGSEPTDVILYFYDASGNEVFRDETTLTGMQPNIPFTKLVGNLIPRELGDVAMIAFAPDGSLLTGVSFIFNKDTEPSIGNATAIDFSPSP